MNLLRDVAALETPVCEDLEPTLSETMVAFVGGFLRSSFCANQKTSRHLGSVSSVIFIFEKYGSA